MPELNKSVLLLLLCTGHPGRVVVGIAGGVVLGEVDGGKGLRV